MVSLPSPGRTAPAEGYRGGSDMAATELIYVPFNAAGIPTGVARMPAAIHAAGVEHRLASPVRSSWIPVTGMTTTRGASGLVNEHALVEMVAAGAAAVRSAWQNRATPIVVAGDRPVLLAPLIAAAADGGAGLVFLDGHEDAWDPHLTPTGEASDCEIGLALGLFSGPSALDASLPCLRPEHVAVLGPRDHAELAEAGQPSVHDRVATYRSCATLAASTASEIAELVTAGAAAADAGWWLHVDLDVLDTASLPAVDYPQPAGLTWTQLEEFAASCLSVSGCLGASVVIYHPDLDDGRSAGRIADFIAFLADRLASPG